MDHGDVGRDVGEMQRLLNRGVAAADHGDLLAAEEEPVAGRAGRDAEALERLFARKTKVFGLRSGRQNDRLRRERASAVAANDERPLSKLEPDHVLALDARADVFGLRPHLLHEPRPLDRLGETGIILHVGRGHQLAALLEAGQHQRFQESARGIDRRRVGGWPGADDDKTLVLTSGRRQFDPQILGAAAPDPLGPQRRSFALIWGRKSSDNGACCVGTNPAQSADGNRRMTNSIRSPASSRQDSISVM